MKNISKKSITHGTIMEPLSNKVGVSFEFFPPKTTQLEESLWFSVERLVPLKPNFVSVTYGAGGSTRQRTHETINRLLYETSLKPIPHITCIGDTEQSIKIFAKTSP